MCRAANQRPDRELRDARCQGIPDTVFLVSHKSFHVNTLTTVRHTWIRAFGSVPTNVARI